METTVVEKAYRLSSSAKLMEITITGLNTPLGMVDDANKVIYLPTIDCLHGRIARACLNGEQFQSILGTYAELGSYYQSSGYTRRHIVDE